jgi:hypothetical protein
MLKYIDDAYRSYSSIYLIAPRYNTFCSIIPLIIQNKENTSRHKE